MIMTVQTQIDCLQKRRSAIARAGFFHRIFDYDAFRDCGNLCMAEQIYLSLFFDASVAVLWVYDLLLACIENIGGWEHNCSIPVRDSHPQKEVPVPARGADFDLF